MAVQQRRVAILGVGTIGESLLRGLLSGGWREPGELVATVRSEERAADLTARYGVRGTVSNAEAVTGAELVVIAVKPQDFDALLGEIGGLLSPEQTVLSVAAAIPTAAIEQRVSYGVPVVRAMPNRPATVHEGIAGVCAGAHADDEHLTLAEEALSHVGAVVRVPERYMDAVTAVSGSGPAYFALLAEAMIEAGILLGLSREVTTQLVVQTMLGTAKLLRDEQMHPVELREMVTSPGGTTAGAAYEAAAVVDWSRAEIWFGDDRAVPPDDERSNYRLVRETLLARVTPAAVHRIEGELGAEEAAARYDELVDDLEFAFALNGIGSDGHTASLFPSAPGLHERERHVIAAEPGLEPWVQRVTMTPPVFAAMDVVVYLITRESKGDGDAGALKEDQAEDPPSSLDRG